MTLTHELQVRIIDDDMPLAQFAVAFAGASWKDPDSIALMVMQSMLGSWNKNVGGGKHLGLVFCLFTPRDWLNILMAHWSFS